MDGKSKLGGHQEIHSVAHRPVVHCVDVFTSSWTRTNPNSLILSRFFSVASSLHGAEQREFSHTCAQHTVWPVCCFKRVKFDVRKTAEMIWSRPNVKTDENDQSKSTNASYLLRGVESSLRS